MRRLALFGFAAFLLAPVQAQERPRNVIVMVADGAGPSAPALTRRVIGRSLVLDDYLTGTIATTATSHEITDSAASATAYACGVRSYKGSIGVDSTGAPCRTILEAAEENGMASGLVTTAYLADATPGAFATHARERAEKDSIAEQLLQQGIEVLLGGGSNHFLPPPLGTRSDGRNLLEEARAVGYDVITSPSALGSGREPLLGLFAPSTMDFEIDRDSSMEPSLSDMTRKAMSILSEEAGGFFLMIETEGTDDGGHYQDGAALAREMESFDDVFRQVIEFVENDGNTLVIALSDHDTGGLGVGRNGSYNWHAGNLSGVVRSTRWMQRRVREGQDPFDVFRESTGISDLNADEHSQIAAVKNGQVQRVFARILSDRAGIGWSTTGHTEADVFLYSHGPGSEYFRGHLQNYEVGQRLFDVLGF